MCVLQKSDEDKRSLRRTIKQLSAYVRSLTLGNDSQVTPADCAAEEMYALRLARQNNPELIKWIPRPITYPEDVSYLKVTFHRN